MPPVLRLLPLSAALSLLLSSPPAHSQSLIALYEAAREYDATYQGARAQYDASIARAAQAKAGILPQIGLNAGVSRSNLDIDVIAGAPASSASRDFTTQNVGINAVQPLYRPANWAAWEQGKRQAEIAEAVLITAEQDLIVRVSQGYFDVLAAQDTLALVRAQKSAVAEQLAFAKRNFEVGTSTITDSREAQARYDLVVAQEISAENDLQVRRLALDILVGRNGSAPLALAAPVVLPSPTPADMSAWVAQAEVTHPSIRQARLALDVAGLEVQKAKAGAKPTIDANLGYNVTRNPNGTSTTNVGTRATGPSVGVVFNMPLFAGFAVENRIVETMSLEQQSRATLDSTRRSVVQATRTAYLGLVSGAGQVKALEAAEASSQSALDANLLGYQVGVRINIDVLNSQSQLFQTKRDLAVARYNVLVGNLRLKQATGILAPPDLQPIDATLVRNGGPANSPASAAQQSTSPSRRPEAPQSVQSTMPPQTRPSYNAPATQFQVMPPPRPPIVQSDPALPVPVVPPLQVR